MPVSDWSTDPNANSYVGGVLIAEGCPAANINNAERTIMAEAKTKFDAIDAALGSGGTAAAAALAALTPAADKVPYFTGTTTAALTTLTTFGRSLIAGADAAAVNIALGALAVTASSLGVNGYITLSIGGAPVILQWGALYGTFPEGVQAVSFTTPFPTACWQVIPVPGVSFASTTNDIFLQYLDGSATTTSFSVFVNRTSGSSPILTSIPWFAIGG